MITDSQVDQLKKLKDLLDVGILTQEEFDEKKQLILEEVSLKSEASNNESDVISEPLAKQDPVLEEQQDQIIQDQTVGEKTVDEDPVEEQQDQIMQEQSVSEKTVEEDPNSAEELSYSQISSTSPEESAPDKKEPFYKRKKIIALIAALAVVAIAIAAISGNKSGKPTPSSNSNTADTTVTTEPEEEEEPEPVITGIEASYTGSTETGTVLNEENDGILVTAVYDDDTTSTVYDWTIPESKALKTGESTTVTIAYETFTCDLTVKCTTVDPETFKASCAVVEYEKLARNPHEFEGKPIKIQGKVIQVLEEDNTLNLRVATRGSYDDVVLVQYTYKANESRVLEDDTITLWGKYGGTYTYESTGGANITVPLLYADYLTIG